MIVDSSAIVAILFEESDHEVYVDRIAKAGVAKVSAPSLLETCVVIYRER
jgi:uncharacterized protein with PIN domain